MDHEYDVALSFAGEDRGYVEQVAHHLEESGVRVFYDRFETVMMWGEHLVDLLDRVYRTESRYTVIFISQHYLSRAWPRHERQSAQARALIDAKPYLLPVRFDDSELPGLPPTIGYLDLRGITPIELAELIMKKLALGSDEEIADTPALIWDGEIPPEPDVIVREKPQGWEYMLLAAVIARGIVRLRPKRSKFEMAMVTPSGPRLSAKDALSTLSGEFDALERLAHTADELISGYLNRAVGEPGTVGDAEMIRSAADALIEIYESTLDWAERVRSYNVPAELYEVATLEAQYATAVLRAVDDFSSRLAALARDFPELLRRSRGEPLEAIVWRLMVDSDLNDRYARALNGARRRLKA